VKNFHKKPSLPYTFPSLFLNSHVRSCPNVRAIEWHQNISKRKFKKNALQGVKCVYYQTKFALLVAARSRAL
jgi:hypothetical protein